MGKILKSTYLKSINLDESRFEGAFEYTPSTEKLLLPPWIYNLERDVNPLWQCPGYDPDCGRIDLGLFYLAISIPGEQYPYGRLAVKNTHAFHEQIGQWGMTNEQEISETRHDSLRATAVSTLFNWLNGQAHCAGYTQYTDDGSIDLKSQLVLSDGREFFFAIGQLRYIAFNINWDLMKESNPSYSHLFPKRRSNRVLYEGPYNLFDEYDPVACTFKHRDISTMQLKPGLNPIVLQYLLQMLVVK